MTAADNHPEISDPKLVQNILGEFFGLVSTN